MKRLFHIILFSAFSTIGGYSQADEVGKNIAMNGYLSLMPSMYWNSDMALWQGLVHNRLNFSWYASNNFSVYLQMRNQLISGDFVNAADYSSGFEKENYSLPLTYQKKLDNRNLLSMSIDRLWLQYVLDKLEIKIGRQRINWSQTFVWNPNDIFNTYNFFDFDYFERPGSDAIRVQYYTGVASSLDLAAKIDSSGNITAAGLYKFNKWNSDFQFMGGYLSQENSLTSVIDSGLTTTNWADKDLVAGLGFSGAIKNLSLRGELSYFYSLKEGSDSTNQLLISLASDYTFSNSIYIMFEFLYASNNFYTEGSDLLSLYGGNKNIKTQTITRYNSFGQIAYPINPILNATLAGMCFSDTNLFGFYAGPSLEVSLSNNMSIAAFAQFFFFKAENTMKNKKEWVNSNFAFIRWKWNF